MGHLGKDPEKLNKANGEIFLKLSVATSFMEKTEWHSVLYFGKGMDYCQKLRKGDLVDVEGRLSYRSYVNKDNLKSYTVDIIASQVLGLSKNQEVKNNDPAGNSIDPEESELPF